MNIVEWLVDMPVVQVFFGSALLSPFPLSEREEIALSKGMLFM